MHKPAHTMYTTNMCKVILVTMIVAMIAMIASGRDLVAQLMHHPLIMILPEELGRRQDCCERL